LLLSTIKTDTQIYGICTLGLCINPISVARIIKHVPLNEFQLHYKTGEIKQIYNELTVEEGENRRVISLVKKRLIFVKIP
jgi:hypothetical protein